MKNLAKERNNTTIGTNLVLNGDKEMGKKSNRRKKGQQVQVEKVDSSLNQHNNPRSSDSTTPSSSVSSNESDSSSDKVQNPVTGGNIEGNQSVTTTGEESPLTNSDGEPQTLPSSDDSPFSIIDSGQSTSGDEGKDDDNTLVLPQPIEGSDEKEEPQIVVKTGKVDKKVEGSSTGGDDQAGNEKDIQEEVQDPTSIAPQSQESIDVDGEIEVLNTEKDQIQPGTTTASSSPFTPSACSTPAINQQGKPDDNNLDLSSSDDNQSQTPEKFTGNENTASENTKRSAVAISTLAIAAAALVAASIYFEVMLTAGAIAGACCLAAAVITYFHTQPSTSLENTMANKQDNLKVGGYVASR